MRKLLLTLALWFIAATPALASNCSPYPFTLQNGQTADANQVMANFNNVLNCANSNLAHNGANSDITSITGLTTPLAPSLGGTSVFVGGTTSGSANAQTLASTTPNSFTLTIGSRVTFIAGFTNTGPMTLNVRGQGAVDVDKLTTSGPAALEGGEVVAGNSYEVSYDGTEFQLAGPAGSAAYLNAGTTANQVLQLDGSGQIPAGSIPASGVSAGSYTTANITVSADGRVTAASSGSLPSPGVHNAAVLSSVGAGSWTVPSGVDWVFVTCVGGGGGGGGGDDQAGKAGGNGGFGGTVSGWIHVGGSSSISYNVGGGGSAGPSKGGGGGGGTTWFSNGNFGASGGGGGASGTSGGGNGGNGGAAGTFTGSSSGFISSVSAGGQGSTGTNGGNTANNGGPGGSYGGGGGGGGISGARPGGSGAQGAIFLAW